MISPQSPLIVNSTPSIKDGKVNYSGISSPRASVLTMTVPNIPVYKQVNTNG